VDLTGVLFVVVPRCSQKFARRSNCVATSRCGYSCRACRHPGHSPRLHDDARAAMAKAEFARRKLSDDGSARSQLGGRKSLMPRAIRGGSRFAGR
jgi:hypothetical protein